MLVATRDDEPRALGAHYQPTSSRSLGARFTSGVQLIGSLVGIPLALIGGYSTYHVTFSPEGKCQALRSSIVSMLDKKTDPTTLRLLIQKDVATFEHECGTVDADAAAAFRHLLAADSVSMASHRVAPPAKAGKFERVDGSEAAVPPPPVKTERAEKHEQIKREAAKREASAKEAPAKETIVKREPPKQLGTPPQPLAVPPPANGNAAMPLPQVGKAVEQHAPAEAASTGIEKTSVDANWVASVREALRESASQPPTIDATSDGIAPQLAAPIDISPEPRVTNDVAPERRGDLVPPADVGSGQPRPPAPRPPASIPSAN